MVDGQLHRFDLSHVLSDPMESLIDLCSALIDRIDCVTRFYAEPGETIVRVSFHERRKDLVDLTVFTSDREDGALEAADQQIGLKTKTQILIDQIFFQLAKIEALCNDPSYAADRTFPREAFRRLIAKKEATARITP